MAAPEAVGWAVAQAVLFRRCRRAVILHRSRLRVSSKKTSANRVLRTYADTLDELDKLDVEPLDRRAGVALRPWRGLRTVRFP